MEVIQRLPGNSHTPELGEAGETARMPNNWCQEIKDLGVAAVARKVGLSLGRRNDLSPCPACRAEKRGTSDRRGPIGMTADGMGWRCHRCDVGGNAVTLAAMETLNVTTTDGLSSGQWSQLRQWWTGLSGNSENRRSSKPQTVQHPKEPLRPPRGEVEEVWTAASRVDEDVEVRQWLENRGLNSGCVADRDLARAVPKNIDLPPWCSFRRRPWTDSGHRLIVKMFDSTGEFKSIHARSVLTNVPSSDKAAAPAIGPVSVGGLVMADSL